jgi:hypothetical protein
MPKALENVLHDESKRATDKDAQRAREILWLLQDRAQGGIGVLAYVIEADKAIPQSKFDNDVDWIARISTWYALQALTMNLARALDQAGPDRDNLHSLFELIEMPNVLANVLMDGQEAHMLNARKRWCRLLSNVRVGRLRELRNWMLAHNLSPVALSRWPSGSLYPAEIVELADEIFSLIDELCCAFYGASSIGECRARAPSAASQFWRRLTALGI